MRALGSLGLGSKGAMEGVGNGAGTGGSDTDLLRVSTSSCISIIRKFD